MFNTGQRYMNFLKIEHRDMQVSLCFISYIISYITGASGVLPGFGATPSL